MKISKLFHWLYGFLMLMPIFSVLVSSLYVVFNDNAKDSFGDYSNTQLINGNSTNVIVGNTLYLSYTNDQGSYAYSPQYIFSYSSVDFRAFNDLITYIPDGVQFYSNSNLRLRNSSTLEWSSYANIWGVDLFNLSLILKESIPNYFAGGNLRVQVIYNSLGTLDNVFTYSLNQLKDNDLYNWSLDSFLSTPFTYILNLFNVPNDSVMLLLLSYWLDISIIWLTFDVLMYVPLLTHRWLDKGVLE